MIVLTKAALESLSKSFAENENKTIRINHTATSCCGGSKFDLGLGQPTANDVTIEESGFTFIINKNIMEQAKSFYIDVEANGWLYVQAQCRVSAGTCCN